MGDDARGCDPHHRRMLEAFGWGLLSQLSLLLAGLAVCWVTVPTKVVGILGGFGAGAMIAAVSFDLLPEAMDDIEPWQTGLWMMIGVASLSSPTRSSSAGSAWQSGRCDGHRRRLRRRRRPGVDDPYPGRHRRRDQPRVRRCSLHSNIPQAIAPSADSPRRAGPAPARSAWLLVVLACAVAAALGFLATDVTSAVQGDRAAARWAACSRCSRTR